MGRTMRPRMATAASMSGAAVAAVTITATTTTTAGATATGTDIGKAAMGVDMAAATAVGMATEPCWKGGYPALFLRVEL